MKILNDFVQWMRDPFGHKSLHERHRNVRKDMIATVGRTEEFTTLIRESKARDRERRRAAHVVEKAVLGQHRRSPTR